MFFKALAICGVGLSHPTSALHVTVEAGTESSDDPHPAGDGFSHPTDAMQATSRTQGLPRTQMAIAEFNRLQKSCSLTRSQKRFWHRVLTEIKRIELPEYLSIPWKATPNLKMVHDLNRTEISKDHVVRMIKFLHHIDLIQVDTITVSGEEQTKLYEAMKLGAYDLQEAVEKINKRKDMDQQGSISAKSFLAAVELDKAKADQEKQTLKEAIMKILAEPEDKNPDELKEGTHASIAEVTAIFAASHDVHPESELLQKECAAYIRENLRWNAHVTPEELRLIKMQRTLVFRVDDDILGDRAAENLSRDDCHGVLVNANDAGVFKFLRFVALYILGRMATFADEKALMLKEEVKNLAEPENKDPIEVKAIIAKVKAMIAGTGTMPVSLGSLEARRFNQEIQGADMKRQDDWFVVNKKFADVGFSAVDHRRPFHFPIGDRIKRIEDHLFDDGLPIKIHHRTHHLAPDSLPLMSDCASCILQSDLIVGHSQIKQRLTELQRTLVSRAYQNLLGVGPAKDYLAGRSHEIHSQVARWRGHCKIETARALQVYMKDYMLQTHVMFEAEVSSSTVSGVTILPRIMPQSMIWREIETGLNKSRDLQVWFPKGFNISVDDNLTITDVTFKELINHSYNGITRANTIKRQQLFELLSYKGKIVAEFSSDRGQTYREVDSIGDVEQLNLDLAKQACLVRFRDFNSDLQQILAQNKHVSQFTFYPDDVSFDSVLLPKGFKLENVVNQHDLTIKFWSLLPVGSSAAEHAFVNANKGRIVSGFHTHDGGIDITVQRFEQLNAQEVADALQKRTDCYIRFRFDAGSPELRADDDGNTIVDIRFNLVPSQENRSAAYFLRGVADLLPQIYPKTVKQEVAARVARERDEGKTVHLPRNFQTLPLQWGDEKDDLTLPDHWPQAWAGCARRVIIGYSVNGGETFQNVVSRKDLAGKDFRRAVPRGEGVLLLEEPVDALVLRDADSTPRADPEVEAEKKAVKEALRRKYRQKRALVKKDPISLDCFFKKIEKIEEDRNSVFSLQQKLKMFSLKREFDRFVEKKL